MMSRESSCAKRGEMTQRFDARFVEWFGEVLHVTRCQVEMVDGCFAAAIVELNKIAVDAKGAASGFAACRACIGVGRGSAA